MLVVETIAKIRRAFFKQGKPIKAICRELGVSRKVVRKVFRSGETEFSYEREVTAAEAGRWRERSISYCQRTRQSHHVSA